MSWAQDQLRNLIVSLLNPPAAPNPPTTTMMNPPNPKTMMNAVAVSTPAAAAAAAAAGSDGGGSSSSENVTTETMDGIAQELCRLSIQERQQIDRDVYGRRVVASGGGGGGGGGGSDNDSRKKPKATTTTAWRNQATGMDVDVEEVDIDQDEEDPTFISKQLDMMEQLILQKYLDENLQQVTDISKVGTVSALTIAMEQDPSYVQNKKFCLAFLRAEEYNPQRATQRLVAFLEEKKVIWGVSKLTKDITLKDMTHDDLQCLYTGSTQHVPEYHFDYSGRPIMVSIPALESSRFTHENYVSLTRNSAR